MKDHVSEKGVQRAELARRTGCNLETIRYYEKIGMLPTPPRTAHVVFNPNLTNMAAIAHASEQAGYPAKAGS